jgi:hypothetical protein
VLAAKTYQYLEVGSASAQAGQAPKMGFNAGSILIETRRSAHQCPDTLAVHCLTSSDASRIKQ